MPDVQDLLVVNDSNVRKWGLQLFFVLPMSAPVPETWFGTADHLPLLPAGAMQLGYITTDGISQEDSIDSEGTTMIQNLEPVRSDLTGIERTLTVSFGEDNAWVQALWHGVPLEEWPERSDGPWAYSDGAVSQYPELRVGWIGQDGIGADARYRVEFGHRATVTAKEARSAQRSDPETYGFTFGLYRDKTTGLTYERLQNGPAYHKTPTV